MTNKLSVQAYVNRGNNRTTYKIKGGYLLDFLTPETIFNLLGSPEKNINTDINVEMVPNLEMANVIVVQCNVFHNGYQEDL